MNTPLVLSGFDYPDVTGMPISDEFHLPADDFIDRATGAQYFLHRHGAEASGESNFHFHFFKRWAKRTKSGRIKKNWITHLAALKVDHCGQPQGWFAVNQWVVGDMWLPAQQTVALFENWHLSSQNCRPKRSPHIHWHQQVSALIAQDLHGPISTLLNQRDQILSDLVDQYPDQNVLEMREFEVLCETTCATTLLIDGLKL